jgi:hypothetical protein
MKIVNIRVRTDTEPGTPINYGSGKVTLTTDQASYLIKNNIKLVSIADLLPDCSFCDGRHFGLGDGRLDLVQRGHLVIE